LSLILSILRRPTDQIVRERLLPADDGAGILWSVEAEAVVELSALGAIAWEGRDDKPAESRYDWTGLNLLCNAAPTAFDLNAERFHSVDSFAEALKFAEGTPERGACAMAPALEAKRLARRIRGKEFTYCDRRIAVGSSEHEAVLAAALSAKVAQHPDVRAALRETGSARLVFPLSYSRHPGALARVTPLALMIERWKLVHRP
jgi:predicted NAD-dependent protein-ADP-ribosyltransferase YbiA (DUF1768 family)